MFSLIITIISIALVAALALATLYYGGNAFNKGSAEADASKVINEGQQINGAVQLARADSAQAGTAAPATLADLVTATYLQQLPASFSGAGATALTAGVASSSAISDAACQAVNVKAGLKAADTAAAGDTDTALVVVAGDLAGKVFGCVSATKVVNYKF